MARNERRDARIRRRVSSERARPVRTRGPSLVQVTLNFLLLVAMPLEVVTVIVPVAALAGTFTTNSVAVSFEITADFPLKVTLVAPARLVPLIVTFVPGAPEVGEKLVIVGGDAPLTVIVVLASTIVESLLFPARSR